MRYIKRMFGNDRELQIDTYDNEIIIGNDRELQIDTHDNEIIIVNKYGYAIFYNYSQKSADSGTFSEFIQYINKTFCDEERLKIQHFLFRMM